MIGVSRQGNPCAWCQREAGIEDTPGKSHGICDRHVAGLKAQIAERRRREAERAKVHFIEIGMRVRSFDFESRRDCYMEGVVEAIGRLMEGCPRYTIRCERRILGDREVPQDVGRMFFPPVNGTPSLLGGVTNFVEEVGDGQ